MFDFDWMEPARPPQTVPCIRWVQAMNSGIRDYVRANDPIDTDFVLTTVAGEHASGLTEFCVFGLRYILRDVPGTQHMLVENRWKRFTDRELAGQPVPFVELGVFETEPLPTNCPLWDLLNVLISPQSARTVVAENRQIVCLFAEKIIEFLAGDQRIDEFGTSNGY